MGIDWGDVPTWVAGAFAAVAAIGATATLKSQKQQLEEQRDFLRAQTALLSLDHRDRVWKQALKISCSTKVFWWLSGYKGAVVRNGSDAPITDVQVTFGEEAPVSVWSRWGSHASLLDGDPAIWRALRGRESVCFHSRSVPKPRREFLDPSVAFTDAGGVRWCLGPYGDLRQIEPS